MSFTAIKSLYEFLVMSEHVSVMETVHAVSSILPTWDAVLAKILINSVLHLHSAFQGLKALYNKGGNPPNHQQYINTDQPTALYLFVILFNLNLLVVLFSSLLIINSFHIEFSSCFLNELAL